MCVVSVLLQSDHVFYEMRAAALFLMDKSRMHTGRQMIFLVLKSITRVSECKEGVSIMCHQYGSYNEACMKYHMHNLNLWALLFCVEKRRLKHRVLVCTYLGI